MTDYPFASDKNIMLSAIVRKKKIRIFAEK